MTILAVQCRLSSSRLPGKALLPLGGKTVLDWTLCAMRKIPADAYYVATDESSYQALIPFCERNGFSVFKGPLEDVLERYCLLIEETGADTVIRATADNPFLFYEAGIELCELYKRRRETSKCDYITFTGLPHGSGIEMFDAASLLKARTLTDSAYDHEHVGPSLYNHPESFRSVMVPAPEKWNHPELRTTIDTPADYRRALAIVRKVSGIVKEPVSEPYTSEQILGAFSDSSVLRPVLTVPCVRKGKGTGHLRRCLSVAFSIGADVYIPEGSGLEELSELVTDAKNSGLESWQIIRELPKKGDYAMILTDAFALDRDMALKLSEAAPVCAIDEGSLNSDLCDFLIDIIPSYGISRSANVTDPTFVTLPDNKRLVPRPTEFKEIKSILVTVGGEDPSDLVVPTCIALSKAFRKNSELKVTAIVQNVDEAKKRLPEKIRSKVKFIEPVHNLREKLADFDVVISHYGFTAFEAVAAGCGVLLLGTTNLHVKLAQKYNFKCLGKDEINEGELLDALKKTQELYPDSPFTKEGAGKKNLGEFVNVLSKGRRFSCPVCQEHHETFTDFVEARTPLHTFRRCSNCGMIYMSWTLDSEDTKYNEDYFFADYKKQYGKTYLDDFVQIKSQCVRRTSIVDSIYRKNNRNVTPSVLDIGCAFGPYIDAANDSGWQVFGTDASKEAVDYVQNTLHYPAVVSKFPAFNPDAAFGVKAFDAVTMWYVIEHFQNLDAVLKGVSKILRKGGIFAFSTPSAQGVSGRFNTQSFFQNSPADHYTIWEPSTCANILKRYGFKVQKIVSTGHHPERFPKMNGKKSGVMFKVYSAASRFFSLGDTFEVYCVKEKEI